MRLDLAHDVPVDRAAPSAKRPCGLSTDDGMPGEGPAQSPRLVVDDISLGHAASLRRVATLAG